MSDNLPAPLVAAEVDLTGFSSFMLDVDRLLASELVAIGTPEECWAAVMLWCRAWKQQPAASLPDDAKVLAAFSGARQRWPKVKDVAMRGFVKCSDGRLYHKVLAAEANEAWARRLGHRDTADNKTERQNRWRQRVKEASERIRAMGLSPPKGASLETLERMIDDGEKSSRVDVYTSHVDVSKDGAEIGKTGQDRTGQDKERAASQPPRAPDPERPSAKLDRIMAACSSALGDHAPADPVIGPIALLIERGAKLDEVLTILRSETQRPRQKPIRTWKLWAEKVAEQLASAPAVAVKPPRPEDPADPLVHLTDEVAWPESLVRKVADRFDLYPDSWPDGVGPAPGRPGCRVPEHLLPERLRTEESRH